MSPAHRRLVSTTGNPESSARKFQQFTVRFLEHGDLPGACWLDLTPLSLSCCNNRRNRYIYYHGPIAGMKVVFRAKDGRILRGWINGEPMVIGGRPCLLTVTRGGGSVAGGHISNPTVPF